MHWSFHMGKSTFFKNILWELSCVCPVWSFSSCTHALCLNTFHHSTFSVPVPEAASVDGRMETNRNSWLTVMKTSNISAVSVLHLTAQKRRIRMRRVNLLQTGVWAGWLMKEEVESVTGVMGDEGAQEWISVWSTELKSLALLIVQLSGLWSEEGPCWVEGGFGTGYECQSLYEDIRGSSTAGGAGKQKSLCHLKRCLPPINTKILDHQCVTEFYFYFLTD